MARKEVRDYKHESAIESPERKRKRAQRKRARRLMEKEGKVKKGDGKIVNHKKSLKKGGSNSRSNLEVHSKKASDREGGKSGNRAGKARGGRKSKRS